MKVYEAHNVLSRMLGDETTSTSSGLIDGVIFGSYLRSAYLYRAMTAIYREGIDQASQLPRRQASELIRKKFPLSVVGLSINIALGIDDDRGVIFPPSGEAIDSETTRYFFSFRKEPNTNNFIYIPMYILSARVEERYTTSSRPYKRLHNVTMRENDAMDYGSASVRRRPDMWAEYTFQYIDDSADPIVEGIFDLYDTHNIVSLNTSYLLLRFLRHPVDPNDQDPNDELFIDALNIDKMFQLAMFYGMIDSQQIEDWSLLLPTMMGGVGGYPQR